MIAKPAFRLRWTIRVVDRLDEIGTAIALDNPRAAARVVGLIVKRILGLAQTPNLGRPGRCPGTRELVVPDTPYIVAYRIREAEIEVLTVLHAAQRWPRKM